MYQLIEKTLNAETNNARFTILTKSIFQYSWYKKLTFPWKVKNLYKIIVRPTGDVFIFSI